MMGVLPDDNRAHRVTINFGRQALLRDDAVDLAVIRNDRLKFLPFAFVSDEALKRIENVLEAIVDVQDG